MWGPALVGTGLHTTATTSTDEEGDTLMPQRVREQYKQNPAAIFDPAVGAHVVPDAGRQYPDDDPIVKLAPWYFIAEGQVEDITVPTEVPIEAATAAPGEKRATRRRV